jgi:hypothetical protein
MGSQSHSGWITLLALGLLTSIPQKTGAQGRLWPELITNDQECIDCHPDQVEAWRSSAMGRGFKVFKALHDKAPETLRAELKHPHTRNQYRVYQRTSPSGELTFRFEQRRGPLRVSHDAYAMIGAQHAQTFLWESEGALFELPLTQYLSRRNATSQVR